MSEPHWCVCVSIRPGWLGAAPTAGSEAGRRAGASEGREQPPADPAPALGGSPGHLGRLLPTVDPFATDSTRKK